MRKAVWAVVAALGLTYCSSGSTTTSSSTGNASPTASATTPGTSSSSTTSETGAPSASPSAPTSAAGAPGSKADYLARAKPICDTVTGKIDNLPEPGNNKDEKRKVLDQRAAALTEAPGKLKALTPPTRDEASLKLILDHLDGVLADTSGQAAAIRAGDTVKAAQLEARFDADESIAKNAAIAYGLGDCGA